MMANLKTNYKDDVLETQVNTKRRYNMIENADGTVSLEETTAYTQVGDTFGAMDINSTNEAVNQVTGALGGLSLVTMTQAEYEALATKDANTIYFTT